MSAARWGLAFASVVIGGQVVSIAATLLGRAL